MKPAAGWAGPLLVLASTLAAVPLARGDGAAALPEPYASADLRRGRIQYLLCAACHDLQPTGIPKVGPSLLGLAGRQAGTLEGFQFSPALKDSGIAWTPAALDRWLENPATFVPGTTMVIAPIPKPEDRAAIVRYVFEESVAR